jgi:pimeloyl-ACP methyl ester carboxylesterase
MSLRRDGRPLPLDPASLREAIPHATGKLLVAVHGSSMNDRQWSRLGHDHAAALEADLGYTAVYVHYNSGLHVSTNGRQLAGLLDRLVRAWPVEVTELTLLGHSMGGLVSRSACHLAELESFPWRAKLRRLVTLGTPHHGSPLERGGSALHGLLEVVAYSAPLARLAQIRSAGVTDLRYGNVLDGDWEGRDRFVRGDDPRHPLPLPAGVLAYAVAGSTAKLFGEDLPGDGLVPVPSAFGQHALPERTLAFPEAHRWVSLATNHLDLLSRAEVYARVRDWLSA